MNPINHVAIIMDGNGRWGIKNKGSRKSGHRAGLNTIETIIEETLKQNINYLTLYTFSTENWKRPKLKILGNKQKFDIKLQKLLNNSEKETSKNNKLQINLALNYGSKEEILNAIKLMNKKKQKISEKNIENNLYTRGIPNPDLLIRTGNTNRLSNFLIWQAAYTEIFFEKKLWPDFTKNDYKKILKKFKNLKRSFGAI